MCKPYSRGVASHGRLSTSFREHANPSDGTVADARSFSKVPIRIRELLVTGGEAEDVGRQKI